MDGAGGPKVARRTALVVDDDGSVREYIRAVLEDAGFDVLTAIDGQEAVELFSTEGHRVTLVLIDDRMPRMSGDAALVELLRMQPEVRYILMTGTEPWLVAERYKAMGARSILGKPFQIGELLGAVEKALAPPKGPIREL